MRLYLFRKKVLSPYLFFDNRRIKIRLYMLMVFVHFGVGRKKKISHNHNNILRERESRYWLFKSDACVDIS